MEFDAINSCIGGATVNGALTERYRPRSIGAVCGQPRARQVLSKFATRPYTASFLFFGPTGTGKTSAALALAAAVGCDVRNGEMGGVYQIASGEQSADTVRETWRRFQLRPLMGSGWKVLIVNEADRMHAAAETVWLDRLEQQVPRRVVIFTTNNPDKLAQRFRDRCIPVEFRAEEAALRETAIALANAVIERETGAEDYHLAVSAANLATEGQFLSFRRLFQALAVELLATV